LEFEPQQCNSCSLIFHYAGPIYHTYDIAFNSLENAAATNIFANHERGIAASVNCVKTGKM
jgi:hypothetical protein